MNRTNHFVERTSAYSCLTRSGRMKELWSPCLKRTHGAEETVPTIHPGILHLPMRNARPFCRGEDKLPTLGLSAHEKANRRRRTDTDERHVRMVWVSLENVWQNGAKSLQWSETVLSISGTSRENQNWSFSRPLPDWFMMSFKSLCISDSAIDLVSPTYSAPNTNRFQLAFKRHSV
jgi:hypothetical protein